MTGGSSTRTHTLLEERLSPVMLVTAALVIAVGLSTQYLFQPFVWTHWPWDEVLLGWLEVLRDRTLVAVAIATALLFTGRGVFRTPLARAIALAVAIAGGAVVGEGALAWAGFAGQRMDLASVAGRIAHWFILAGCIAAMYYAWLRMRDARRAAAGHQLMLARIEQQIVDARLRLLRSQIEPHFLFNTLATVRRLRESEPVDGARLLGHFVDYLRLSTSSMEACTTLDQELRLVRAYLGVVGVRMAGRLRADIDVPAGLLACELPPLTVATLVENAVKHGIAPRPGVGSVVVRAQRVGDALEVEVRDDGVGFQGTLVTGLGLANVRERLATLYGDKGTVALHSARPRGVRAIIRLPLRMPADERHA